MMKASICCCCCWCCSSWVGLLDRDSELGEVEMEIEVEGALSAYAVLPRDAILDSQPSEVVC